MNKQAQSKALKVALTAAKKGAAVTLKYFRKLKFVDKKEGAGLVSEADRESEAIIRKVVLGAYPTHRFLGEEGGMTEAAQEPEALWVVDPLDGTTNYVHGFPFFCISIGLEVKGQVEVAVVHAPLLKFTFRATRGGGAFLNDKPIKVSHTDAIEDSLLATGFSYKNNLSLANELKDFRRFSESARGIRRAGSAALDLCMVAAGIFDGFWERDLAPWDTAAGSLIVQEAGGRVSNFRGDDFHFTMSTVAAGNPQIHRRIINILSDNS